MTLTARGRIALITSSACLLVAGSLAQIRWPVSSGLVRPATLRIDTDDRDLGIVMPGTLVPIQYRLNNDGSRELVIKDLHTSCGCSPASLSSDRIPPGGQETVSVNFRVPEVAGLVQHAVTFTTNDPGRPHVVLSFRAMARWPIIADPARLHTGVILRGASAVYPLELSSTDGKSFAVREVRVAVSWIRVSATTGTSAPSHRLQITIDRPPSPGRFEETVTFVTDSSRQPTVVLPVVGEVVTGLRGSPSSLMLGNPKSGAVVSARLIVNTTSARPLDIRRVALADGAWKLIRWEVEKTSGPSSIVKLDVQVPNAVGYQRTLLRLDSQGVGETLEVPVSALVTAR